MNVNLKLLHTFLLVAEHSSFCRAAEESNRSQSAVSMQVRQLELQLGVSLFQRTTRSVQLTREGKMLLGSARRAMMELQSGLRQIKEATDMQRGRLSLACSPTIASTRLPEILTAFQQGFPNVIAHVHEQSSTEMLQALRRQEVDFAIGPRVSNAPDYLFRPLLLDEILALIPLNLGISAPHGIRFTDLAQLPLLTVQGATAMRALLEEARLAAGVTLNIRHEVRQVQTQIAMAASGLGVALVPRIAIPAECDPRLQIVPIIEPDLSREICVITLRGQTLPPVASRFVALLQRMLSQSEETLPSPARPKGRPRADRNGMALVVRNG